MTDEHEQQGQESPEDEREVGGYGDQGEAEALAGGADTTGPDAVADPDEGSAPQEPSGS